MKKQIILILCIILSGLILCGCGCEHQWQSASCTESAECTLCGEAGEAAAGHSWKDADCGSARTCTLCGETEGEALGHQWQPADCVTAESCAVCGETRGEPTAHSYGEWELSGDEMLRTCLGCGAKESGEIDREALFRKEILGNWEIEYVDTLGSISDYSSPVVAFDPHFCFYEDGSVRSLFEAGFDNCTWEYTGYERQESDGGVKDLYHIEILNEGTPCMRLALCYDGERYLLLRTVDSRVTYVLSRHRELEKIMPGTWSASCDGKIYSIELLEDRSFSGDVDGSISGFWQTRSLKETDGGYSAQIVINCKKGGVTRSFVTELGGYEPGIDARQQKEGLTLPFALGMEEPVFIHVKMEEMADIQLKAHELVTGDWVSTELTFAGGAYNTGPAAGSVTEKDSSVLFSFTEDGKYSALIFEDKLEGQWAFEKLWLKEGERVYTYRCTDRRGKEIMLDLNGETMEFYYIKHSAQTMSTDNMFYADGTPVDFYYVAYPYVLCRMERVGEGRGYISPENQLVGKWISTNRHLLDMSLGERTVENTYDYWLDIREDGSFSCNIPGQSGGTWGFDGMTAHCLGTEMYLEYNYWLSFKDGLEIAPIVKLEKGFRYGAASGVLNLEIDYARSGAFAVTGDYNYYFVKADSGLVEECERRRVQLIGSWTPVKGLVKTADGEELERLDTEGMYLELYEDGRYKLRLTEEEETGRWVYNGKTANGHRYFFYPEGEWSGTSPWIGDGVLRISRPTGQRYKKLYAAVDFEKQPG